MGIAYQLWIGGEQRDFYNLKTTQSLDTADIGTWEAQLAYADEDVNKEDSVKIKRKNSQDATYVTIFKGIVEYIKPIMMNDGTRMRTAGGRHATVKLWRKWAERNVDDTYGYWSDYYPHKILQFLARNIKSEKPRFIDDSHWIRIGWGINPTGVWTVTASSSRSDSPPDHVTDRYAELLWVSNAGNQLNQWIKIDLGSAKTISGIRIENKWSDYITSDEWAYLFLRGYKIEYSLNGSSWTTLTTVTTNKARNIVESWTATSMRYIRITGTVSTSFDIGIGDIYVYQGSDITGIDIGIMEVYLPFNCSEITEDQVAADQHIHVRHSWKYNINDHILICDGTGQERSVQITGIDGGTNRLDFGEGIGFDIDVDLNPWCANMEATRTPKINMEYMRRTDAMDAIVKNCIKNDSTIWDWWITDDGALWFAEERGTDLSGSVSFQYAQDITETEHNLDNRQAADSVLVLARKSGANGEYLQDINSSGWIGSGDYELVITDKETDSEAASIAKAYEALAKADETVDNLSVHIDDDIYATGTWGLGDYVNLVDSGTGVSGDYRVIKVTRKYDPDGEDVTLDASSTKFTIGAAIKRIFREGQYNSMFNPSEGISTVTRRVPGFYLFFEAERLTYEVGAGKTTKIVDLTASGSAYIYRLSTDDSGYLFRGPGVTCKSGDYKISFYIKVASKASSSVIAQLQFYSATYGGNIATLDIHPSDFTSANYWQEFSFPATLAIEYNDCEFRVDYTTGITQLSCDWVGLRSSGAGAVDTYLDYPLGAPAVPTGLAAVSGPLGIKLTWNANSEFDLDHYIVWKNTTNNPGTATIVAEVDTTYFVYHGAAAEYGVTLYFWLSAIDWTGHQSDKTSSVNATVLFIDNVEIGPNAVEADNIQNAAVIEAKIADLAISNSKLKNDVVTSGKLAGSSVYTRHLVVFQVLLDADPFSASGNKLYWTAHNLRYEGTTYAIAANSAGTSDEYIWWDVGASAYAHSNTKPDLSDTTLNMIVCFGASTNTIYQVWRPTVVHGGMLIAQTITGLEITGDWIVGKHFTTSLTGARVYIDDTGIYGTDGTNYQFYLLASTGKAYCGAGAVILDKDGITVNGEGQLILNKANGTPVATIDATIEGGRDCVKILTVGNQDIRLESNGHLLKIGNGKIAVLGAATLDVSDADSNLTLPCKTAADGAHSTGDIWIRSDL